MEDNQPELWNSNSISTPETVTKPVITFQGNNYDLTAIVAVTIGGVTLLSCVSFGLATYCLPFLPIVLGVIGLVAAKDAVNPERTKRLSWISIGIGAIILLLLLALIIIYIVFIAAVVGSEGNSF